MQQELALSLYSVCIQYTKCALAAITGAGSVQLKDSVTADSDASEGTTFCRPDRWLRLLRGAVVGSMFLLHWRHVTATNNIIY